MSCFALAQDAVSPSDLRSAVAVLLLVLAVVGAKLLGAVTAAIAELLRALKALVQMLLLAVLVVAVIFAVLFLLFIDPLTAG
jgi:hypothetical protein